jgi:hypothetical protein
MKLLEAYDNGTDAEREALMKLVGKERLKMLVNELKTENWIANNSKPCPWCKTSIEVMM